MTMVRCLMRGFRFVIVSGAALAMAAPVLGAEPDLEGLFMLDPAGALPAEAAIVKPGKPLLTVQIRQPNAVRLSEQVDPESAARMAASADYPLQPGQILMSVAQYHDTYCAVVESRGLSQGAPCLVDADDDGRFEAIKKARFTSADADGLEINYKSRIVGVKLSHSIPLPHPVAYTRIGYRDAPAALGSLIWRPRHKDSASGRPREIAFAVEVGQDSTGTTVLSNPVSFKPGEGEGDVEIHGILIHILGFEPDGSLRFKVVKVPTEQSVAFGYWPAKRTIYVYMAR